MMDVIKVMLFLVIFADHSSCQYVNFHGPAFAKKTSMIQLNCSSLTTPTGCFVKFKMNDMIFLTVRRFGNVCYVPNRRSTCDTEDCSCSSDGRWFTVNLNTSSNFLILTCEMNFNSFGHQSDTVRVEILDYEGPFMSSRRENITVAGSEAQLRCWISHQTKQYNAVKFEWKCPSKAIAMTSKQNKTTSLSEYTYISTMKHNGEPCTCIVHVHNFTEEIHFILEAHNSPILIMEDKFVCNVSTVLTIVCSIKGELTSYGFFEWMHTYNKKIIRHIRGEETTNTSVIVIDSCSYEHFGQYVCSAWNEGGSGKLQTNASTYVYVRGVPSIERFYVVEKLRIQFEFLSTPEPTNLEIHMNGRPLFNFTMLKHVIRIREVDYTMINHSVTLPGYVGSIDLGEDGITNDILTLLVENDYGKVRKMIGENRRQRSTDFSLSVLMWIISTISLIIITTTLSTLRILYKNNQEIGTKLQIYHAAPSTADTGPAVYDRTDPFYQEIVPNTSHVLEVLDNPYLEVIDNPYQEVDDNSSDTNMADYEEIA